MDLDLSQLSHDQLLQLLKIAMIEATQRGHAIATAAHDIYEDAAADLRDRVKKTEAARHTDPQIQIKAALITALVNAECFAIYRQECFEIGLWERLGEIGVRINQSGQRKPSWKFDYYHTGNAFKIGRAHV